MRPLIISGLPSNSAGWEGHYSPSLDCTGGKQRRFRVFHLDYIAPSPITAFSVHTPTHVQCSIFPQNLKAKNILLIARIVT